MLMKRRDAACTALREARDSAYAELLAAQRGARTARIVPQLVRSETLPERYFDYASRTTAEPGAAITAKSDDHGRPCQPDLAERAIGSKFSVTGRIIRRRIDFWSNSPRSAAGEIRRVTPPEMFALVPPVLAEVAVHRKLLALPRACLENRVWGISGGRGV